MRSPRILAFALAAVISTGALAAVAAATPAAAAPSVTDPSTGKIKHIIWIMQENRSFDHYFGTYPGANGIPTDGNGNFLASDCLYDPVHPAQPTCPSHSIYDTNSGGDHSAQSAINVIDGGKMDGYQLEARRSYQHYDCSATNPSACNQDVDAMTYHDAREIPNYWQYAQNFGLADNAFEFTPSYSLPSHLYMVSEWSGDCRKANGEWVNNPMRCNFNIDHPSGPDAMTRCEEGYRTAFTCPVFAWTSMTYLLRQQQKTWNYFIVPGEIADCTDEADPAAACANPQNQSSSTSNIWNPLTYFPDVEEGNQEANIQDASNYFTMAKNGTLPSVSWIVPSAVQSEHPNTGLHGKSVHSGQAWVTSLINAAMSGPDWNSTAVFVTWDDWGGFYDHVTPPNYSSPNRQLQAGLRVPMLIVSPYAKKGVINHRPLGLDSINRFIQDVFLNSQRLDPKTDGRPDSRGVVSENRSWVNDLSNSFNFSQKPLPPLILPTDPLPGKPSCIDGRVCDTFYVTNMSTRSIRSGTTSSLSITAAGLPAGTTVRVDARNRYDVATATVASADPATGVLTFSVNPSTKLAGSQYSLVLTAPDGRKASCNGCLTIT